MFRRYGATDQSKDISTSDLDVARCDHYAFTEGYDDYTQGQLKTPLTANLKSKKLKNNDLCGSNVSKYLLFPILLLTGATLLYSYQLQSQLISVSSQLNEIYRNISSLQLNSTKYFEKLTSLDAIVTNHSTVIARFENSVSNSDVLDQLETLQKEWNDSQEKVKAEMESTKTEIRSVLESTKKSIDESVTRAQNDINTQVSSVQTTLSTYIRTTQDQFSTENSFMIYQLAGTFTLLGCLISMWHMTSHLRSFHQPVIQRKILAILWMCPIYSVTSWLSLVIPKIEGYLAILKDLYEAYVIYQFLSFLIAVLGKGNRQDVVDLLAKHADHLSPPVRCFGWCRKELRYNYSEEATMDQNKQLADDVLLQCQVFAMQFVFLRPILTTAFFILKKINYHGPMFGPGTPFNHDSDDVINDPMGGGMLDYRSPQFYLVIFENFSVFVAFSGLLKFYHAVQDDLSWCRPFPKFLCIKGVVFMTFWQGVAISLLADTTDLLSSENDEEQEEKLAKQTQNFLICLEMLGFSIAHFYCFPVEEWQEGYRPVEDKSRFGDNMALGDFLHDLKLILRHNRRKKQALNSGDSITTLLEDDEDTYQKDSKENDIESLLDDVEGLLDDRKGLVDHGASDSKKVKSGSSQTGVNMIRSASTQESISESLKDKNAPKELREATALLLQSRLLDEITARLLTNDILEVPLEVKPDDVKKCKNEGKLDSAYLSNGDLDDPNREVVDPQGEKEESLANKDVPSEMSSLLTNTIQNEELLRPSIFTMYS